LGSFDNTSGTSTTFTAGVVGGLTTITSENITLMVSDSFDIDITSATVDYIQIRDSSSGAGSVITNLILNVGESNTLWAAAYNYSVGYLGDFSSTTWSESSGGNIITVSGPGSSTLVQAQMIGGSSTITADYTGIQNTTNVLVTSPTVDYIILTEAPNGLTLSSVNLNVGESITIFASGFNFTSGYTGLVEVDWGLTLVLGTFDNLTGNSTTFTARFTEGSTNISEKNTTLGVSDSFDVTINSPGVDYLKITDSPDGVELITVNLNVGDSITIYASSYNSTSGYVGLLSVNWSESAGLGSFDYGFGTFTTFTAGLLGGSTTITGENVTMGISGSFEVIINPPSVDFLTLTDNPDGVELTTVILSVGESITIYASGYNLTSGYVDLVNVNWDEPSGIGTFDILFGTSTTFTAGMAGGSSAISGENLTLGISDSFYITITAPTVDYILIRTQSGGGGINLCEPVNYQSYPVGASDFYYGAQYNNTAGYIGEVPETSMWDSSDSGKITVTSPGNSTTLTCSDTDWGTVEITLDDGNGHTNTTQVMVLEPTVNYIQIRDEPGGSGNIVTAGTYIVWQVVNFYAATYNYTAGYLGEIDANWASSDTTVGTVTTPGHWTNFTAQKVDLDSVCQVIVEFHGIENSTGDLLVLTPTIDFISIMDSSGGTGNWIGDMTFNEGDYDIFWCAGFNLTTDYVKDVEASWESNNTDVGTVQTGPDEFTKFTAGWVGGYCRITATYNSLTNETGDLFVININQLPTSNAEYHNETGFAGGDFSFDTNLTLRVTGRKDNEITMGLKEDDTVVEEVTVTRTSGQPDIGEFSYEMDVQKSYDVILQYEGYNGGSNPIIVTFEFLGNIYSVQLLFNSQHGEEQTALIDFDDVLKLVGVVFFDGYNSSDFEGYLVDYHWEFGDGTEGSGMTLAHTYEENGIYTVNLTVTDNEGGTDTDTITVYVENIDNNDQVNAILGSNASQGYLNGSGQYVVILECPADLVITNKEGRQIGLIDSSIINEIPGAFVAKLYSDIEVYYVPYAGIYNIIVDGNGHGSYNLTVIAVNNDLLKKYSVYDVTCNPGTQDIYNFGIKHDSISISTQEIDKSYSLEFLKVFQGQMDRFYISDMGLDKDETHVFEVKSWETLSSGKPVTLYIDEDSDRVYEDKVDLESGLTGADVDNLLIRQPVSGPGFQFPILFIIIVGSVLALGACGLLTEVGKWALLSLFIPLYSRIKKDKILDQPIRYKIHGFILGNPGAHFGLIKHVLELPNGQLAHHLNQLIRTDLIYSKSDGAKKRFYPMDYPKSEDNGHYLSSLQEKILVVVKENSGISQKKVASKIGISRQVAGYHLALMEQGGLVKKEVVGRESRYHT
jgi:PKD repeat protein